MKSSLRTYINRAKAIKTTVSMSSKILRLIIVTNGGPYENSIIILGEMLQLSFKLIQFVSIDPKIIIISLLYNNMYNTYNQCNILRNTLFDKSSLVFSAGLIILLE